MISLKCNFMNNAFEIWGWSRDFEIRMLNRKFLLRNSIYTSQNETFCYYYFFPYTTYLLKFSLKMLYYSKSRVSVDTKYILNRGQIIGA